MGADGAGGGKQCVAWLVAVRGGGRRASGQFPPQISGLSGRAFAAAAGCQASKVSQIEKAIRPASMADVRLWCHVCRASPQHTEELLKEQAAVARLWIAFRDLGRRTGLDATQKMLSGDMWERVRLFRAYQTKVVPGLLQTAAYMTGVRRERGVEVDDIAEAVAERIGRQGYLLQRDRQFVVVVVAASHQSGRPAAARRGLLGIRPPDHTVELPAR
jgi:Domain of unknown function (DUF5753)/Helix-turn-helix domain